jgi:hypothetical protein
MIDCSSMQGEPATSKPTTSSQEPTTDNPLARKSNWQLKPTMGNRQTKISTHNQPKLWVSICKMCWQPISGNLQVALGAHLWLMNKRMFWVASYGSSNPQTRLDYGFGWVQCFLKCASGAWHSCCWHFQNYYCFRCCCVVSWMAIWDVSGIMASRHHAT